MPGVQYTGGNIRDYLLGRGIVSFDGDQPATYAAPGFRDVGNCTDFTVGFESETKEHLSYLEGLKVVDQEIIISQKVNLSFTLDELNFNNLALFLQGFKGGTNATGTPLINSSILASDNAAWAQPNVWLVNILVGTWYDLELIPGILPNEKRRAYDFESTQIRSSGTLDVRKNPANRTDLAGGTGLVERTAAVPNGDFELDRRMGRIRFFTGGPGAIAAPSNILVHWEPAVIKAQVASLDGSLESIAALAVSGYSGRVRLMSVNPIDNNHPTEWTFHSVKLRPEGDLGLITDETAELTLVGTAQALSAAPYGLSRYLDVVTRRTWST